MSTEAMKWARIQRVGSPALKAMVNTLAARADARGNTWVSQTTLAADLGASDRHVRAQLAVLELLGVIVRTRRSAGRRGRLTDTITLAMHRSFDLSAGNVRRLREQLSQKRSNRKMPSVSGRKLQPEQIVVATGTRVPGNTNGTTPPSHGGETPTSQDVALPGSQARVKVVGGLAFRQEGGR